MAEACTFETLLLPMDPARRHAIYPALSVHTLVLDPVRLAERFHFRRCTARLRDILRGWQPSWALTRPTPRAAHADPRLTARGRRLEERDRAARAR